MKTLKARTILLISALSYFIAVNLPFLGIETKVIYQALLVLGFICLILGAMASHREKKEEGGAPEPTPTPEPEQESEPQQ